MSFFFLFLSFPSFFQSTSVMVLITWFCLCQHPSGSGFDWKQLFCPFLVRFTRCSAWNKIQLGRTKFFLRGKYFKPIGSFVCLIYRLPCCSLYFWESRASRFFQGSSLALRRLWLARGNDISKVFSISYDVCIFFCVNGFSCFYHLPRWKIYSFNNISIKWSLFYFFFEGNC